MAYDSIRTRLLKAAVLLTTVGALLGSLLGCDENHIDDVTQASTGCVSLQAQIFVGDGYFRALCGCSETSNDYIRSGQTLTCTVGAGTTLFFLTLGDHLKHQVISTGDPSFGAGPMSDPSVVSSINTFATKVDTVGTYTFFDPFNPGISGTLIVH